MGRLKRFVRTIQSQPKMVGLIVIIGIWTWIGLTIFSMLRQEGLSENELVNRQTRVNQGQLDRFTQDLEAYRDPAAFGTPATVPFRLPATNEN